MKVLLVDAYITGHHLSYALKIIDYLVKTNSEVYFLTTEKPINKNDNYWDESILFQLENIKTKAKLIKVELDSSRKYSTIIIYKEIFKMIRENRFDIIHLLYLDSEIIPLLLSINYFKNIKNNSKIIGTIHWSSNIIGYKGIKRWLKVKLFNYICKFFDLFFVHGENCKNDILVNTKLKSNKIKVIPYGTEKPINIDKIKSREKLNINISDKVILFFGGLRKDKGIDILLESLKYIKTNITLIVAGKANGFEDIFEGARNDNVKIIKHLRYINDEEIPFYFSASDVLILPYKKIVSGQSGPLTIATTYGLPTIGTDVGEIGITIKKYNIGIVTEPESPIKLAEAIDRFFKIDEKELNKIKENLKNYVLNNSWDVMCDKLYENYRALTQI